MVFVALLRGINVGGNNKVEMKRLKSVLEELGFSKVKTYINSGNVIFESESEDQEKMTSLIENNIEKAFGFPIKVLLRDFDSMEKIINKLPDDWQNNTETKCDVMFLWDEAETENFIEQLPLKKEIDEIIYLKGALIWFVERKNVTRSGLLKIVGTKLYKQMTIRNSNTVRKLFNLMSEIRA